MSKTFVVYEVWTRHKVVQAESESEALEAAEPKPITGMSLSNWHAVEVPGVAIRPAGPAMSIAAIGGKAS
jgi:hypothetical protein